MPHRCGERAIPDRCMCVCDTDGHTAEMEGRQADGGLWDPVQTDSVALCPYLMI